jgi:hypothetical protein
MSVRMNRGTRKLGSGWMTKPQTSCTLARSNNGIPNPPAWTNSIRVTMRTQHFPCPSGWTREPQVWHLGGSPNLTHLHARLPSCLVKEPRIFHTCTNSISTDRGAENFPHSDDHARPDGHGNPRSAVQVEGDPRISHSWTFALHLAGP